MVRRRVQTRVERKRSGPEEWLVVTRRPLTDERTWEPRASRDATEQDARHRYQDSRTPTEDAGGVEGAIAWGTGARHQSEPLHCSKFQTRQKARWAWMNIRSAPGTAASPIWRYR